MEVWYKLITLLCSWCSIPVLGQHPLQASNLRSVPR